MAEGLSRRAAAVDNLRGAEAVEPVTRNVPGVSAPSTPRVPVDSFGAQIAQSVSKFASGALAQAQKKRQERSMVDGQIAAMQGKSFESVEMEGDKWALEGYRIVSAQTMSASLLRSQEQEINSGGYEMDPDAYRETLVNRIDTMTSEIGDERTRELARESLMQQMPTLIDSHMKQNLGFKESQNFEALAQSVDVLSRDNSSTGALITFATGESEATSGLSIERRRAAVVQGVINAFENNNPAAYAHLDSAEYFNTENLTASQIRTINSAKAAYHSRMEGEWNAEWKEEDTRIREAVAAGDMDSLIAVELFAANNAKHGRRTSAANAGAIYDAARAGIEFDQGTRGINIQAAAEAGDYNLQAELMQAAVIQQESGGDPNAKSPVGATGIMQLMPDTMLDPGYGIRNIFQVASDLGVPFNENAASLADEADKLARNPEVNSAMGTEYLAKMLELNNGNVQLALVSYNAGYGNAQKLSKYGGDWDALRAAVSRGEVEGFDMDQAQHYEETIQASMSDNRPDPEGDRLAAEANLKEVRKQAALTAYENATPQLDVLDEQFRNREIGRSEWIEQSRAVMDEWGMELDMQRLNQEAQIHRSVIQQVSEKAKGVAATEREIAMADEMRVAEASFNETIRLAEQGQIGREEVQAATQALTEQRMSLHEKYGVPYTAAEVNSRRDATVDAAVEAVRTGRVAAEERVVRQRAAAMGTAGALPQDQQDKLVAENNKMLQRKYQNAVAANQMEPETAEASYQAERLQYLATTGIVDETQKRVLNAGLDQEPLIDGKPNPAFQESIAAYMTMKAKNPAVADKYVDIENRALVDSMVARVGTNGNLAAAVYSYGNQRSVTSSRTSPWKTPEEFRADPMVEKRVRQQVKAHIAKDRVGLFQGLFNKNASVAQAFDRRTGLDYDTMREQFEDALVREVLQVQSHHPNQNINDIMSQAQERVSRRYASVGNNVIDAGPDNDAHELFFGSRADEQRDQADSINAAIMNYVRTPAFRAEYPDIENSTASEILRDPRSAISTWVTGAREFHTTYNIASGKIVITYDKPNGSWSEPIPLDPAEIGELYLQHLDKNNR